MADMSRTRSLMQDWMDQNGYTIDGMEGKPGWAVLNFVYFLEWRLENDERHLQTVEKELNQWRKRALDAEFKLAMLENT